MKRKEEEGDVKLQLNKSSTRGNVLTLALTLGTLISVLFLFVGGIIGWLYKQHQQRNDISEMHPEMYDLKGNVIPDEIIAFRFENLNFEVVSTFPKKQALHSGNHLAEERKSPFLHFP